MCPIYVDSCKVCGHEFEYLSKVTEDTKPCPKCGGGTDRVPSLATPHFFKSFRTKNIRKDGREIAISSDRELARACHEHGVIPVTDGKESPPETKTPIPE